MAKDSAYFTGDRGFWDDGDFGNMSQQLIYAMLWQSHGTDIAGIRQRNDRLDSIRVYHTLSKFQNTLLILSNLGKIILFDNKIWIKAAIWHNLFKGKYSPKQMEAVKNRLSSCGSVSLAATIVNFYREKYSIIIPYEYPSDTPMIGYPSVSVSVSVSETVSETITSPIYDDVVIELTQLLKDKIVENKEDYKFSDNWNRNSQKAIDLMIRKDNRDPNRIRQVIEWCQDDDEPRGAGNFCWAPNIRSGAKLREQFDKLDTAMESQPAKRVW